MEINRIIQCSRQNFGGGGEFRFFLSPASFGSLGNEARVSVLEGLQLSQAAKGRLLERRLEHVLDLRLAAILIAQDLIPTADISDCPSSNFGQRLFVHLVS